MTVKAKNPYTKTEIREAMVNTLVRRMKLKGNKRQHVANIIQKRYSGETPALWETKAETKSSMMIT